MLRVFLRLARGGGIFSGMKNASFPADSVVLEEIGHEFIAAHVKALARVSEDVG